MKKFCLIIMVTCFSIQAYPQRWVEMMKDPSVNFYTVQKEFNNYWAAKDKKDNRWFRRIISFGKDAETEKAGYEIYKRWENFMEPRVYPKGNRFDQNKAWTEFHKFKNNYQQKLTPAGGTWTALGPTSWQTTSYNPGIGRVNGVTVDPNNPNIIYAGAPSGGFWKSTNGGTVWATTTDTLPVLGVSSIVVDYTNSSHLYIATGDGDAGDTYSIGILESIDGGASWNTTGLSFATNLHRTIGKIIMHPTNHLILYAATNIGIYRTTDGGANWTIMQGGSFRDIEFKPNHPNVVYTCGDVFYRSTNGGNTFTQVTSGVPSTSISRLAIAVSPADSNYVYMVAGNNSSTFDGLYLSTNGGTSFIQQSNSPNIFGYDENGNDNSGQCWYDLTIAVSPSNKNEVYVGGINIWKSTDGGVSWNISTHWVYGGGTHPYVHADQHALEFYGNVLYAGCDGGLFRTSDYGTTWNDITAGIEITQFYRLAGTPSEAYMLMGGAQDNGCNRLKSGIWTHVLGADGMEVAINSSNTQIVYAESQGGGINRSIDGGNNFSDAVGNITGSGDWITPYMLDPNNPNTIYAGFQDVWKSTVGGTTWSQISSFTGTESLTILNVAPSNSNVIYASKGANLYKTINGGSSWTNISSGLPTASASMTYLTISPSDPNKIWITFSGYSATEKVYKSINGGSTWINYTGNLPNLPVNCAIAQNGSPDGVYIGTEIGVFYRDTTLLTWQPYWNGLPNVIVDELEIHYGINKIRAATFGRGMWESDLYAPVILPPVASFSADKTEICPGDSVHFTNMTVNAFTSCHWSFPGGSPASSTAISPEVIYPSNGTYNAQLIVVNSYGSDTLLKTLYINVHPPQVQTGALSEGFQGVDFPPLDWKESTNGAMAWEKTTDAGGYGTSSSSTRNNNYGVNNRGFYDILYTPSYNMNTFVNPKLKFDYAYARYNGSYTDTLRIFFTTDCGTNKYYLWSKDGLTLTTAPDTSAAFVPTAGQWRSDSIDLAGISTLSNVQFGFEDRSGYGNYIYVDNINLSGFTGIDELDNNAQISVYPNPGNDNISVEVKGNFQKEIEIKTLNTLGQAVITQKFRPDNKNIFTINISGLDQGVYFLHVTSDGKSFNKKIMKL
jgi:PKD repeat protein/photosystem II stability/assembly factor-like uncharacterized protein